jgi:hypothetical protein
VPSGLLLVGDGSNTILRVEPGDFRETSGPNPGPVRLTGKDAFWLHFTLSAGLIVCFGAFGFELWRALGGHTFSWLYVFEWPLFAAFAIYMWWNLLQGKDRVRRPTRKPTDSHAPAQRDEELEAWNRYVRAVEADDVSNRDGKA